MRILVKHSRKKGRHVSRKKRRHVSRKKRRHVGGTRNKSHKMKYKQNAGGWWWRRKETSPQSLLPTEIKDSHTLNTFVQNRQWNLREDGMVKQDDVTDAEVVVVWLDKRYKQFLEDQIHDALNPITEEKLADDMSRQYNLERQLANAKGNLYILKETLKRHRN